MNLRANAYRIAAAVLLALFAAQLPGCGLWNKLFKKDEDKPLNIPQASPNIVNTNKEKVIPKDATPPPGYDPVWFGGVKSVEELGPGALLYHARTRPQPDSIHTYVQLMDREGAHYAGAASPPYRDWWCLVEDSANGKVDTIRDFKLEEYTRENAPPIAINFVMDFSGSMGDFRCDTVQRAMKKLVAKKRKQDAFGLVKFDDKVEIVERPTTKSYKLEEHLEAEGMEGFGGMTAIIDAGVKGVETLDQTPDYTRKFVVIFSDGEDNFSMTTRDTLVSLARDLKIPICAIDFGDSIDATFMREIALRTGGTYHHIYGTDEFHLVFNDIYQRLLNYYYIGYEVKDVGLRRIRLAFCPPDTTPLSKSFFTNNTPLTENEEFILEMMQRAERERLAKLLDSPPAPKDTLQRFIVYFGFDKSEIRKKSESVVEEATIFLHANPETRVVIRGHTDYKGGDDYNLKLSNRRCVFTKNELMEGGIGGDRIDIFPYGEKRPATLDESDEGRALNRRAEILVISP